jgi:hypothetical protein
MEKLLKITPIFLLAIFVSPFAVALDFIVDEKFNAQVIPGYRIDATDTFAGFPIFATDGDWVLDSTYMGSTTGGTSPMKQPFIYMSRYENGKWLMGQTITLTTHGNGSSGGWLGDPCAGEKIVKINQVRSRLDRCATAYLNTIRVGGVQTETLEIGFIESNFGGRFYKSTFNINFQMLGFDYRTVTDKSNEFNKRLKEWMGKVLDGTVKAAGYGKPADAFKDIPTFTDAVNATTTTLPPARTQNPVISQPKNIQDRLQVLKDLLDKKLITQDDFDKKRKEILNSL